MTQIKDAIAGESDLNKAPDAEGADNKGAGGEEGGGEGDSKSPYEDIDALIKEGEEDEEVTIKRGSLKKIRGDVENYKTVALSKKGAKPDKKGDRSDDIAPTDTTPNKDEVYVKKADLEKERSRTAIELATVPTDDDDEATIALKKEIDENWDAIRDFYTGKSGKETAKDIHEDILDAHAAWKRRTGGAKKGDNNGAAADIAAHHGSGGSSPKEHQQKGERKRILPKANSPKDWYPKKD